MNDAERIQDVLARAIFRQLNETHDPDVHYDFDDPRLQTNMMYTRADITIAALAEAGYTIVKQDAGRTGEEAAAGEGTVTTQDVIDWLEGRT